MIKENKAFDIPGFTFFAEKNIYTGSITENREKYFNYKIYPGEKFKVTIWKGPFCLVKTPETDIIETEHEFEFTKEGLSELNVWLREQQKLSFENY